MALVAPGVRAAGRRRSPLAGAVPWGWEMGTNWLHPSPAAVTPGWEAEPLLLSMQTQRCQGRKEVEERRAGMGSTAKGAGKLTAQDLFDAAFFSRCRSREDSGSKSTELLLVSSCPGRLAWGKREQPRFHAQPREAAGECERWHPATLRPLVALPSFPPKSGWKRSCLPLEVSSAAALLSEVGLYLLRARPCFIELFHEVCPATALPWAVVTVLGDEQCRCLQGAGEVGALSDFHEVFLLLAWVLGQVLTCSEVTGPETHQVVSALLAGRSKKSGNLGMIREK